ncbi:hypothetical protein EVAR_10115_1 [Eumeta japonica]|uniref:Uncharacterized protein n=1 Tax=Eumeta variegata TaxID=151549 RepID=A0A4C1UDL5_EUMVA|nr:hypothetical protein EVAR_10115_1 [Eumeta japonica]
MTASEQTNDGDTIPASGATEAMQVDDVVASISTLRNRTGVSPRALTAHRCHPEVPIHVETSRDSLWYVTAHNAFYPSLPARRKLKKNGLVCQFKYRARREKNPKEKGEVTPLFNGERKHLGETRTSRVDENSHLFREKPVVYSGLYCETWALTTYDISDNPILWEKRFNLATNEREKPELSSEQNAKFEQKVHSDWREDKGRRLQRGSRIAEPSERMATSRLAKNTWRHVATPTAGLTFRIKCFRSVNNKNDKR